MASLTRNSPEVRARLPGERVVFGQSQPMPLDCGVTLGPFTVAYRTYGRLNKDKSNAILVCHALTGDQFMADTHPITGKPLELEAPLPADLEDFLARLESRRTDSVNTSVTRTVPDGDAPLIK